MAGVMAGAALVLSACELPKSFEELIKSFENKPQAEEAAVAAEQPQDEAEEAAQAAEPSEPATAKATRKTILAAQRRLAELDYQPGPLDGLDGPKTGDAVRQYQADAGLAVDGRVTEALVAKLLKADDSKPRNKPARKIAPAAGPKPATAAMPVYEPGDTFVYSDGRVETVTGVEGDKVSLRSNDGTTSTAYKNFILPALDRKTNLLRQRTTLDIGPDALWPLKVGKEVSFFAKTEVIRSARPGLRSESAQRWRCRVEASETITVAAGTFDTFRVACRTSTQSAAIPSERIWYYAPRVRHYVRRDEKFEAAGTEEQVELVAIQLAGKGWPPAARAGLGWAFQQALETKSRKQSLEWGSSGVDVKVTIKPTAALAKDDSPYCRTFEQTVRRAEGRRIYPGKACRDGSGQWLIPGLEDMTQAARKKS